MRGSMGIAQTLSKGSCLAWSTSCASYQVLEFWWFLITTPVWLLEPHRPNSEKTTSPKERDRPSLPSLLTVVGPSLSLCLGFSNVLSYSVSRLQRQYQDSSLVMIVFKLYCFGQFILIYWQWCQVLAITICHSWFLA